MIICLPVVKIKSNRAGLTCTVASLCLAAGSITASASTNVWINPGDGLWQVAANWSSGNAPTNDFATNQIISANTKVVTIDAGTPPANLTIHKLQLWAPPGFTNTLQLTDLTTNMVLLSTLTMDSGGALKLTNSALNIDGTLGGTFNMVAGDVTLESGLIDCSTVFMIIGRTPSASLTVKSGRVLADMMQVGNGTNGAKGTLALSGGEVTVTTLLSLGDTTNSTGIANISGGQLTVTLGNTLIGNLGSGQVTISGGAVNPLSALHIADNAVSTGIVSVVGGQLIATNDITAIGRYGVGEMTISNATALLTNVSVGRHAGAIGTLSLQTNGLASFFDDLSIGRFQGATGAVLITGGQLTLTGQTIWVGREGVGQMILSNGLAQAARLLVAGDATNTTACKLTLAGGSLLLSSNLIVGVSGISTGQVVMVGGNLAITNASGSAFLSVPSGMMTFNAGTLATDNLLLTNVAGQFAFNGGTLQAKSATVANGAPFVVGDGVHPATFQLLGGTYSFANGLVISNNATVTGCGTIVGNISNFGTLATNCPPAGVTITAATRVGTVATIYFTTLAGSNHVLEYKNKLTDSAWTAILPGVVGNGTVTNKIDSNATVPIRFYRIHLQ